MPQEPSVRGFRRIFRHRTRQSGSGNGVAHFTMPRLFFASGTPTIGVEWPRLAAAVFAVMIAWQTRSTFLAVLLGRSVLWALEAVLG